VEELGRTGIAAKVHEFSIYRNEIFHDRSLGKKLKFYKTVFSPLSVESNHVDALQGLRIFLELASFLRYSIPGLDTMPDIAMIINKKAFAKKVGLSL